MFSGLSSPTPYRNNPLDHQIFYPLLYATLGRQKSLPFLGGQLPSHLVCWNIQDLRCCSQDLLSHRGQHDVWEPYPWWGDARDLFDQVTMATWEVAR